MTTTADARAREAHQGPAAPVRRRRLPSTVLTYVMVPERGDDRSELTLMSGSLPFDGQPRGPGKATTPAERAAVHDEVLDDGERAGAERLHGDGFAVGEGPQVHLGVPPRGRPERDSRVLAMVDVHDAASFGGCTNTGECAVACPKEIPLDVISQLDRDYLAARKARRRRA